MSDEDEKLINSITKLGTTMIDKMQSELTKHKENEDFYKEQNKLHYTLWRKQCAECQRLESRWSKLEKYANQNVVTVKTDMFGIKGEKVKFVSYGIIGKMQELESGSKNKEKEIEAAREEI